MTLVFIALIYQSLHIIATPFIGVYLIMRFFKGKSVFGNFAQRFGFVPRVKSGQQSLWLHAVSVGEILATQQLIVQLKQQHPSAICYVTTGTLGGLEMARKFLKADVVSFLPFDFFIPMMMAFKRIRPQALLIVEGDLWPNFIMLARWFKIPLYLLNARVNPNSKKRMQCMKFLYKPLLNSFVHIFTQSEEDVQAFKELGVESAKLSILGNIKAYNVVAKREQAVQGARLAKERSTVLLVGSVHPGELDYYLKLFGALKPLYPSLKLILAPRHFNWLPELRSKVQATGYASLVWDEQSAQLNKAVNPVQEIAENVFEQYDILSVCMLGKLFGLCQLADIFFLGGTFVPVGGHNLLEPAVWGKPCIVGPYHANCQDHADRLEQCEALVKVANYDELEKQVSFFLTHAEQRKQAGFRAAQWLEHEAIDVKKNLKQLFQQLY